MVAELTLTLPRDPRYVGFTRRVTRSMLDELQVGESVLEEVELAVTEACTNAVRHATGSPSYRVTVAVDERGCSIRVVDSGPGFSVPRDGLRPSADERGHGLYLIEMLVDEASFERRADGMSVRLWKSWPDGPGGAASGSRGDSQLADARAAHSGGTA